MTWQTAGELVGRRLAERVGDDGWAGHDGGDMPDSIWVLHAMYQQVDGLPVEPVMWGGDEPNSDGQLRRVLWAEFAERYGGPMVTPGRWPGVQGALPGLWERNDFHVPSEGSMDRGSWAALLEHLIAFSPDGPATACGAYFATLSVSDVRAVYVGSLGEALDLLDLDVPDAGGGPQNVWDLAETWIVYTDYDLWATRVSGPTDLITRLLNDDRLETDRLPDVPERE